MIGMTWTPSRPRSRCWFDLPLVEWDRSGLSEERIWVQRHGGSSGVRVLVEPEGLAATWTVVAVFPQIFGPSMRTTPWWQVCP